MSTNRPLSLLRTCLFMFMCICFYASQSFAGSYDISGPYNRKNLSFFLIHGEDSIKDQTYLTLGEAMQQKKIKVHETSNVNQLSIENLSQDEYIYIQAGDIVKGGKQDRVFSTDMVLEPGSGKIAIASFCVEQGRWRKRGSESVREFHSSTKKLASKQLRLAARLKNNQSDVWQEVAKVQEKLGASVGQDVKARESASSLQLTLENKQLADSISEYKRAFLSLPKGQQNVIGYVFAINGQLNTADVYASQALFRKLWPKIVDAAATESVAELGKSLQYEVLRPDKVQAWMKRAAQGKKTTREIKPGLTEETIESEQNVRFETYSGKGSSKKIYRQNYIQK